MPRDRGPRTGRRARAGVPSRSRAWADAVLRNRETWPVVWLSPLPGLSGDDGRGGGRDRYGLTRHCACPDWPPAWGPFLAFLVEVPESRASTTSARIGIYDIPTRAMVVRSFPSRKPFQDSKYPPQPLGLWLFPRKAASPLALGAVLRHRDGLQTWGGLRRVRIVGLQGWDSGQVRGRRAALQGRV
jgi:hypothetical protein